MALFWFRRRVRRFDNPVGLKARKTVGLSRAAARHDKSLDRSHRQRASHQTDPVLSSFVLAGVAWSTQPFGPHWKEAIGMKLLLLIVATFGLMVAQPTAVYAQSQKLAVLSTKVELVADYAAKAANTRTTRSPARVTANPLANGETESAFQIMDDIADRS